MALGNSTMTYDQLGRLAAHLLHKAFIETTRTVSKGVFRRLVDGEVVPITQLEFEGDETIQLNMKLNMSAHRGDINYTRFRDGVVALLQELLAALSKEGELKTFTANDADGVATTTRLLGVSGPTQHGEDINVLMVALTPSHSEPKILVELMYMDPDQFVSAKRGES
jgi:hypothetical protein